MTGMTIFMIVLVFFALIFIIVTDIGQGLIMGFFWLIFKFFEICFWILHFLFWPTKKKDRSY